MMDAHPILLPVQDIYGLEQSHAPREDLTEEENEDRLCVICLVNERNTTVLPCRHMCMCDECAQELRKQTHKCPICRIHVRLLLRISPPPAVLLTLLLPASPVYSCLLSPHDCLLPQLHAV